MSSLAFELLLSHCEKAFNQALTHDLYWPEFAKKLHGTTTLCHIQQLDKKVYLTISANHISLNTAGPETVDLTITATPSALIEMMSSKRANKNINLAGNAELAQTIQQYLHQSDIDWEGMLADKVGDVPARTLSQGIRHASKFIKRFADNFINDSADYLVDEKQLVVTQHESDAFSQNLTTLRYDVDRLAARIQHLR